MLRRLRCDQREEPVYAAGSATVDCGGRNHSNRISVRIDSERVARTAYVGLQQYAGKHSWSDMPSVHSAVVLFVSTWNLLG